ncbi:MAG: hypothetical protein HRU26_00925 [Psychroserpens sp.]|nr:hypothetical protein [Psychroserpens sp.]
MNDLIDIAEQIYQCKEDLDELKPLIRKLSTKRAELLSNYDKKMAITLIRLKNGYEFVLDGQKIVNPPATVMEKIAKGICYQEKLDMEVSDAAYRSLMSNIETTKAQLNGLQSINKHLD